MKQASVCGAARSPVNPVAADGGQITPPAFTGGAQCQPGGEHRAGGVWHLLGGPFVVVPASTLTILPLETLVGIGVKVEASVVWLKSIDTSGSLLTPGCPSSAFGGF